MNLIYDEETCLQAIKATHSDSELFEIRIIGKNFSASGIFNSFEYALKALKYFRPLYKSKEDAASHAQIYMTLNEISTDCGSLVQRDKIIEGATGITDKDIICIKWLFIDFDPVRRSGISSSNDELNEAKKLATVVYTYLKNIGFEAPIVAMSGNGYHLLYKLNKLENNKENVSLIKRVLEALAYRFSTDDVKIDVVNFNGSRLCKLWGTLAQKGANTSERPHRMSRIEYIPNEIKATPIELLHKVIDDNTISEANDAPKRKKQVNDTQQAHRKSPVNSNSDFDFARLLKDNNITIQQILRKDDGDYYILDHCIFDPSHTGKDAAIILRPDGTYHYHCFHNSCRGKTFDDVLLNLGIEGCDYSGSCDDMLLTVDTFSDFCAEYGYIFVWDEIKHELSFEGFDSKEYAVTLRNTAPTILQGILKPKGYKGASIQNICNCIQVVATRNKHNPILDIIDNIDWDGVDRVKAIYDMLHISDTDNLSRVLILKWLKQTYCLLHNDITHPFAGEFALVLIGAQGAAKTRFFEHLAIDNKYFAEGRSINPDNKDCIMQTTSVWICELGEIGSTMRRDIDKLKAFITLSADEYRVPYGRTTVRYPRTTSFCGTVNNDNFLIDQTGNRRWGTIRIPDNVKLDYNTQIKPFNAKQLWAQVKSLVDEDILNGYTYANCFRLSQDEIEELEARNSNFTQPCKGYIEVSDIINDIIDNVPAGYYLVYKITSATTFKMQHNDVLQRFNAADIGKALQKLGYEQQIKKVDGKTVRGYNLPYQAKTGE